VQLGIRFHDQYDYYTHGYPALLFAPAVVGFFFPLLILRWLKKIGEQRRRTLFKTTLIAAVIVFAVALFFWLLGMSGVI
jgi:hypothetical protein